MLEENFYATRTTPVPTPEVISPKINPNNTQWVEDTTPTVRMGRMPVRRTCGCVGDCFRLPGNTIIPLDPNKRPARMKAMLEKMVDEDGVRGAMEEIVKETINKIAMKALEEEYKGDDITPKESEGPEFDTLAEGLVSIDDDDDDEEEIVDINDIKFTSNSVEEKLERKIAAAEVLIKEIQADEEERAALDDNGPAFWDGVIEPKKEEIVKDKEGLSHEAAREATDKGTIQYLKSVQGRVLTIMEAAFPSSEQREAVKTLIKKEFRREMTRVNNNAAFNSEESDDSI